METLTDAKFYHQEMKFKKKIRIKYTKSHSFKDVHSEIFIKKTITRKMTSVHPCQLLSLSPDRVVQST